MHGSGWPCLAKLRGARVLLVLTASAASVSLTPRQPRRERGSPPAPQPGELRPRDGIVFDEVSWRPNCTDFYQYAQKTSAARALLAGAGLPDLKECLDYERGLASEAGHRSNFTAPPRPLQVLHVSKSAGTFFCNCAFENGQNRGPTHHPYTNCHFLREDWPSWGTSQTDPNVPKWARRMVQRKSPCKRLANKYYQFHINVELNENYVGNGGEVCTEFETALVMRSPVHRLVSHLVHLLGPQAPASLTVHEILRRWPRLANNYFARSLSGRPIFYAPLGMLPASLYDSARRALERFSHVFMQGRELAEDMGRQFNWDCVQTKGRASVRPGGTQSIVDHWKKTWPQSDWRLLEDRNSVDIRLFQDVQLLSFARRFLGSRPGA